LDINLPLKEVLKTFVTHSTHRGAVTRNGEVIGVVTLTDITKYMHTCKDTLFEDKHKYNSQHNTVGTLLLGYKDVITVSDTTRTYEAFLLMSEKKVSGVAIVNSSNHVVGNLSSSDLKQLRYNREILNSLALPVAKFVTRHASTTKPYSVSPDDTLLEVLALFHSHQVYRVYIINKRNDLLGVISQLDLVHALAQDNPRI
jgi:CBS domain-containing protein